MLIVQPVQLVQPVQPGLSYFGERKGKEIGEKNLSKEKILSIFQSEKSKLFFGLDS